ncbi:MAG: hypothetical protein HY291_24375 [Planctomycetes bacterium]|nr:hypothetical protein [Planctomycetota bacterium]
MSTQETSLEERVYQRTAELVAVAQAVNEVCGGTKKTFMNPRDLSDCVRIVTRSAASIPGCYIVIIGGIAVQELGWERYTKDVDVVVDSDHFGELLQKLRDSEFELTTLPVLKHKQSGVEIDLLREGTTLKDSKYPLPHPKELGTNRGFASLAGLIRLKLDARRHRDITDIIEVMKRHLDKVDSVCAALPEPFRKEFLELAEQARREGT